VRLSTETGLKVVLTLSLSKGEDAARRLAFVPRDVSMAA
jgi:hypothetical protein